MSTTRILQQGIYSGIPEQVYHADCCPEPSASSSILKLLMAETPKHAWDAHPRLNPNFESSDGEEKFDRGHACHTLMLNDEHRFEIIDADAYRSNDAKAKRAAAYVAGKVPILKHKWPEVVAMCDAGKAQLKIHDDAPLIFENGLPEQTLVWVEKIRGIDVWCRARVDYMQTKADGSPRLGGIYGDYKSLAASINPNRLHRYAENADWPFQEEFYKRGIRKLLGEEHPDFRFVVHEAVKPHRLIVIKNNPTTLQLAEERVEYALDLWAFCMKNNAWPGFPNETMTLGASPWAGEDFGALKIRREDSKKAGVDDFARMLKWNAPL